MDLSVTTHILNFLFIFHLMLRHAVVAPSRSLCRFHIRFIPSSRFYAQVNLSISKSPPQSLYSLRGLDIITGFDIFCLNRSNILCIIYAVITPWTSYAYKATHKVYTYRIGNLCPDMWEFSLFPGHVVLFTHTRCIKLNKFFPNAIVQEPNRKIRTT